MAEVRRYAIVDDGTVSPDTIGTFVLHSDYAALLARAEAAEAALAEATARIAELEAACSRFVEEVEASDDMKTLLCGCIGSTEQCLTPPTCAWCKLRDALAAKESAS